MIPNSAINLEKINKEMFLALVVMAILFPMFLIFTIMTTSCYLKAELMDIPAIVGVLAAFVSLPVMIYQVRRGVGASRLLTGDPMQSILRCSGLFLVCGVVAGSIAWIALSDIVYFLSKNEQVYVVTVLSPGTIRGCKNAIVFVEPNIDRQVVSCVHGKAMITRAGEQAVVTVRLGELGVRIMNVRKS
ncbi:putative integral membrane protein [Oxalobacteraceae bacterium GrIS 2.11]